MSKFINEFLREVPNGTYTQLKSFWERRRLTDPYPRSSIYLLSTSNLSLQFKEGNFFIFTYELPIISIHAEKQAQIGEMCFSKTSARHFNYFRPWFERPDGFSLANGDEFVEKGGRYVATDAVSCAFLDKVDKLVEAYAVLFCEQTAARPLWTLKVQEECVKVYLTGYCVKKSSTIEELNQRLLDLALREGVKFPVVSRKRRAPLSMRMSKTEALTFWN